MHGALIFFSKQFNAPLLIWKSTFLKHVYFNNQISVGGGTRNETRQHFLASPVLFTFRKIVYAQIVAWWKTRSRSNIRDF